MKRAIASTVILMLLVTLGCSRKGDEVPPEQKGDLRGDFMVMDEYDLLTDLIPVRVVLFEDSTHTFEIESRRFNVAPSVLETFEFNDINARANFYYLELGFAYGDSRDTTCNDFLVYIEDGVVRNEGPFILEYEPDGLVCYRGK